MGPLTGYRWGKTIFYVVQDFVSTVIIRSIIPVPRLLLGWIFGLGFLIEIKLGLPLNLQQLTFFRVNSNQDEGVFSQGLAFYLLV